MLLLLSLSLFFDAGTELPENEKLCLCNTNTHTHPFHGPFTGSTQVSRYQKGNTNLDFNEARDSEWQWHQLGHVQVCTLLQTDNHAVPHRSIFTGRVPFLPPNQQHQSTEGTLCNTKMYKNPAVIIIIIISIIIIK